MNKRRRFPSIVTILPTYRCSAACANCCFDSNPRVKGRIALESLLSYVDQIALIKSVKFLVLSGGEAFLLDSDLDLVIERAHSHGLFTRIVTNGFWATSIDAANRRLDRLPHLHELNFSTGDFHIEFVPIERVIYGAYSAVRRGLNVVIAVEKHSGRKVTSANVKTHPLIREILADVASCGRLSILETPWMQRGDAVQGDAEKSRFVQSGEAVRHDLNALLNRNNLHTKGGCQSVLNTLVITPFERLGACCGLPREEIPELDLGSVREGNILQCYREGRDDFLKIWLALEGPEHILAWAAEHDPTIEWENKYGHQCDACRAVYKDHKVSKMIREHYKEKLPDLLLQFEALDRVDEGDSFVDL